MKSQSSDRSEATVSIEAPLVALAPLPPKSDPIAREFEESLRKMEQAKSAARYLRTLEKLSALLTLNHEASQRYVNGVDQGLNDTAELLLEIAFTDGLLKTDLASGQSKAFRISLYGRLPRFLCSALQADRLMALAQKHPKFTREFVELLILAAPVEHEPAVQFIFSFLQDDHTAEQTKIALTQIAAFERFSQTAPQFTALKRAVEARQASASSFEDEEETWDRFERSLNSRLERGGLQEPE